MFNGWQLSVFFLVLLAFFLVGGVVSTCAVGRRGHGVSGWTCCSCRRSLLVGLLTGSGSEFSDRYYVAPLVPDPLLYVEWDGAVCMNDSASETLVLFRRSHVGVLSVLDVPVVPSESVVW